MKCWYCLQTKHKQEENTKDALESRGYKVYLPLALIDKRKHRIITTEATWEYFTEPLFPTYLFVQISEGEDDFYPITETSGVLKIVKMTKRDDGYLYPTIIPDEIITALRELEDAQGIHSRHKADYEKGDKVQVIRGVFKDFPAEIYSMDKVERVSILIDFFNSVKEIEVSYRDIEPV